MNPPEKKKKREEKRKSKKKKEKCFGMFKSILTIPIVIPLRFCDMMSGFMCTCGDRKLEACVCLPHDRLMVRLCRVM